MIRMILSSSGHLLISGMHERGEEEEEEEEKERKRKRNREDGQ